LFEVFMRFVTTEWALLPFRFVDLNKVALVYQLCRLSSTLRTGVPRVSDANSASGVINNLSSKFNRTAKHVKALHQAQSVWY
jgi:hypothetical protein